jgi:hypothetical protein
LKEFHQQVAVLHHAYGNQALLRMLSRSAQASGGAAGVLQRKSECGGSPSEGGECAECDQKREEGLTGGASGIQGKLIVNQPGDAYEQEADRVADQVLCMPDADTRILRRLCADCAEEGEATPVLLTSSAPTGHAVAPPIVHEVLRSPGQPLDVSTHAFFERRFGHDFRQVRVHTDTKAAASSRAVQATAYTVGQHIVFADNKYAPTTSAGRRLLAHELTHTIQQEGNGAVGSTLYVRSAHDPSEREAEGAAAALTPATITPLTPRLARDQPEGMPSACKVDVRATKVAGLAQIVGAKHLFIVHVNRRGIETAYRAGPSLPIVGGPIVEAHSKYDKDFPDWDPEAPSVTALAGEEACDKDDCLREKFIQVEKAKIWYAAILGPNSNTVVGDVLSKCGIPRKKPDVFAPCWDQNLPEPPRPPSGFSRGAEGAGPVGEGGGGGGPPG